MKRTKKRNNTTFFDDEEVLSWKKEWQDMPEYIHEDLSPVFTISIHFSSKEDIKKFSELIKQNIHPTTDSIWFPKAKIETYMDKRYTDES